MFKEYKDFKIFLITKNPNVLQYVDKKKSIDLSVDLGYFMFVYDVNRGICTVKKGGRNILADSFYHPHIDRDGQVCWGNASATVTEATKVFDIRKLATIVATILSTYNPDSPYTVLGDFKKQEGERL